MRKCGVNFLQKVIAVLISAVLCVGLIVGTGPVDVWAAEQTQTAWLCIEFVDYTGTPEDMFNVYLTDDENNYYPPSVSGGSIRVIYRVDGLQRNKQYYWVINGRVSASFKSELAGYTIDKRYYPVYYKDGGNILFIYYVESGEYAEYPSRRPSKPDFTFVGWKTSSGGNIDFPFSTRRIRESTNIYASWRRTVTDAALENWLQYALEGMVTTNSTTEEYVRNYVKGQIDRIFDIEATVTVLTFNPTYATSESAGSIELEVSVEYGKFSARKEMIKPIPILSTVKGEGWILDYTGTLTITSQEGMQDWVQNGRKESSNLSGIKNIVIQDGVTDIPADAFNGCGNLGSVSIPNTVTSIGNAAFAGASSLGEVMLPSALQSVGDSAFSGCGSLGKVVMQGTTPPASMGTSVFDGCKFVTDSANTEGIVVPAGSGDAYKNAGGAFGEYVKEEKPEVTEDALDRKFQESLENLSVSNDTTMNGAMSEVKKAIDDYFQIESTIQPGLFGITEATSEKEGSIVLEMTVSYGGYSVKKQVTKTIPKLPQGQGEGWTLDDSGNLIISNQTGMDSWVQNGRTEENLPAVKNVLLRDGVTEIPDNAFSGCGNLGSVTIPNTVTGIGNSAFAGASSLDEVMLPPALQNVGDGAFSGCGSLGKVVMQGTVPPAFMGDAVFDGCKFVTDSANTEGILVPPGSEDAYKNAGDVFGEYIKVEKPEVTEEALNGKLQEIFGTLTVSNDTTQDAVKEAVKRAIDEYFHIDSVIMIADFKILGEATTESEGSLRLAVLAKYGANSARAEGTIPIAKLPPLPDRGWTMDEAGNLIIGSQAGMEDWTLHGRAEGRFPAVKSVLIQNGVTDILDDAFSGCCDLGTIVIPDTVTSIGSLAFKHASSLSEITLPPNLQSIGDSAFSDCSSLEKVVMQGVTPPSMNASSAFERSKFVMDNTKGIVVPQNSEDAYKAALGTLGNNILEKHTHSFGSDWIHDEDNHWHECSCGGKGSVMPHIWSDGVVIMPPTETEVGIMGYVCPECLATKTELIPATGGNPSVSGNDNPGGNPSVSGNDNPGGNPSVSGNDNPGGTPSVSGNGSSDDSPSGGNPGGGTSVPGNGNSEEDSLVGSGGLQQSGNSNDLALFWSAFNANTSKDTEPRTADGAPLELYATIAMIAGFFYLLLLFLEKYDITEEKRRESLARLVKWARRGGWPRKLPVMAALLLMRSYYRIVGGQSSKGKKI